MVIYFSGTGNSEYVAKAIADRLDDEVICANNYIKTHKRGMFKSSKPWVFVYPVYVSTIVKVFANFIKESKFFGNKKAYFVATYAGSMGISADAGARLCQLKGLEFMGVGGVAMPQNYIAFFNMTAPDEIERRQMNALKTADQISHSIREGKCLGKKMMLPFNVPLVAGVERVYYSFVANADKYHVTKKCTGCGLCEKLCVLNNIHIKDGVPHWGKKCMHCMACINKCPKCAIEYGKNTKTKKRYRCIMYKKTET